MTTLRKACRNCTSSKRKCTVQVPQCARCAKKALRCVYDLEPLDASIAPIDKVTEVALNQSYDSEPGYCVMKTFDRRPPHTSGTCEPEPSSLLEWVRLGFRSAQDVLGHGKPATFIHPGLHVRGIHNHYESLIGNRAGGVGHPDFKRLLQIEIGAVPIQEALTAVQALLIHLAISLFASDPAEQANAESHLDMLIEWTRVLLVSARPKLPLDLSPWQTWLFGESIRRSIIMSHVLVLASFSLKHGFCSNCLFVESLPFDKRLGLWVAESPQAWIAAAGVKLGEDVGEHLISFHEFAQGLGGKTVELGADMFLSLLAIGHNGHGRTRTCGN